MDGENQKMYELSDGEAAQIVGGNFDPEMISHLPHIGESDGLTEDPDANCKYPPGTRIKGVAGGICDGIIKAVDMNRTPRWYIVEVLDGRFNILAVEEDIIA